MCQEYLHHFISLATHPSSAWSWMCPHCFCKCCYHNCEITRHLLPLVLGNLSHYMIKFHSWSFLLGKSRWSDLSSGVCIKSLGSHPCPSWWYYGIRPGHPLTDFTNFEGGGNIWILLGSFRPWLGLMINCSTPYCICFPYPLEIFCIFPHIPPRGKPQQGMTSVPLFRNWFHIRYLYPFRPGTIVTRG